MVGMLLQMLLIYLQGGYAAGCCFLCRIGTFISMPFTFLFIFSVMSLGKLAGSITLPWLRVFIPLSLFSLSSGLVGYLVKPTIGKFLLAAGFGFVAWANCLA